MKKLLLAVSCSLILFFSCSEEKDTTNYAQDITGSYKGNIVINVPEMGESTEIQKIILSSIAFNTVSLTLNDFSYPIGGQYVNLGNIVVNNVPVQRSAGDMIYIVPTATNLQLNMVGNVEVTVGGVINGKEMDLTIDVAETPIGDIKVTFNGDKMAVDNEKTEALIISMIFEDARVTAQPAINGTDITFYVSDTVNIENLIALTPVIIVSDGATVNPESGTAQDFSQGSVNYTVVAEDGIHKTIYTVTCQKGLFDFENWINVSYKAGVSEFPYQEAAGWSSSNAGAAFIQLMLGFTGNPVSAVEDAHSGKYAAKIETFETSGNLLIPHITAGTIFFGSFNLSLNMLQSTRFGLPYSKEPSKLKGWYKYTPGEDYYVATTGKPSEATLDDNMVDSCSIVAVLFEVNKMSEYLTGVNLHTSDKVILKAELKDGSKKDNWTEIDLDFVPMNGKTYDPSKSYKLAVVCSSSRNGDKFSGAPGSVLIIDDFEIVPKEE